MRKWFLAFTIGANQFVNALMGGHPDETVSSRLGRAREHGGKFSKGACVALERIDWRRDKQDHCARAIVEHQKRLQDAQERPR